MKIKQYFSEILAVLCLAVFLVLISGITPTVNENSMMLDLKVTPMTFVWTFFFAFLAVIVAIVAVFNKPKEIIN